MTHKKVNEDVEPGWWLRVEYDSYTDVTRHADPDERWDADDLAHGQNIHGYSIGNEKTYGEVFPVNGKPDKNKTYWLVYVNYSTGDSFHCETGCICFVDVLEDANDAEYLARVLEDDSKKDNYDYKPLKVKFPSGMEKEICTSTWKGYFESIEDIHVESLRYIKPHYEY